MDIYPAMLNKLFGTKIKVIGGYKDGGLDLPGDGARRDRGPLQPAAHRDPVDPPAMAHRAQDQAADPDQRDAAAPNFPMRQRSWSSPRTSPTRQQLQPPDRHAGHGPTAAAAAGRAAGAGEGAARRIRRHHGRSGLPRRREQDAVCISIRCAARTWRAISPAPMRCRPTSSQQPRRPWAARRYGSAARQ